MTDNLHLRGSIYAFIGVTILSFDALLVRLSDAPSTTVLFWRGLFIGLSLTAVTLVREKRNSLDCLIGKPLQYLCAGLLFSLSSCGFVLSISMTTVANTTVILSIAPFFSALFSFLFNREYVRRHTLVAMTVMVFGTLIVVSSSIGTGQLAGDLLAVATSAVVGLGQTYLRRHRDLQRIPIIMVSGYLMALMALPFADLHPGSGSMTVLAVMGLVQIPLALVLFTTSTRFISAAEASMFMIIETILGPVFVFLFLGEAIPLNTIYGGLLILGGLAANTWLSSKPAKTMKKSRPA